MESVADQPSAPSSTRHNTTRFSSLLRPLRKSSSAKDLNKVAHYDEYSSLSPSPFQASPLDNSYPSGSRSPVHTHTPPTAFGFTSNKARIGRALGESSRAGSHWASDADYIPYRGPISPPSEFNSSSFSQQQQQQRQVDEKGAERRLYLPPPQISSHDGVAEKEPSASIPRYKEVHQSALSALGLEAVESPPFEQTTSSANGRYIGTGLPSAYTHGGNASSQGPGSIPRSLANQSYLPSLLRFDAKTGSNNTSKQTREVQIRQPGIVLSRAPAVSSSPTTKHSFTQDRLEHTIKAASLSSSDGNHSSLVNEESRSTSMTSLRDHSSIHGSKLRRPSQDGPPLSASAKVRTKIHASPSIEGAMHYNGSASRHTKTDSSSTTATSTPSTSAAAVKVHDSFPGPLTVFSWEGREMEQVTGQTLDAEVMDASRLSTISASTPGHQSSHHPATSWVQLQQQSQRTASSLKREDAHQKYLLLQQLHLDEVTSHAPDHDGWLETNNGCERVLMPKPSLKGNRVTYEKKSSDGMTFERNRRGQADQGEQHTASDAAKAQAMLSGPDYSSAGRVTRGRDDSVGFFHHRLPPSAPDADRNEVQEGQSSRPAHINIPPRRSSQSRRRRAETVTPALTVQRAADDDDNDSTPDLATVLAQGRALDAERERWREQYRRSLIKARGSRSKSREGAVKKVRYNEEPLPDLSKLQDRVDAGPSSPIRQAKSTPDLRKSMSRGAYQNEMDVGMGSMCMAPFREPRPKQLQQHDQPPNRHIRQRSKSQEGLSSSFKPSTCFPLRSRRRRDTTPVSDDFDAQEADPFRATQDVPIIISRKPISASKDTAKGNLVQAGGSSAFRIPSSSKATPYTQPRASDDTSYGVAYSAPRPDIGRAAPKEETVSAGRHATTQMYHIASNSNDLRAMLATNSSQGSEQQTALKGKQVDTTERLATVRAGSLGMSQLLQSIDDRKQSNELAKREPQVGYEAPSLPVPPRKNRSSQYMTPSPGSAHVELHPPTPILGMDGLSIADDSFGTPTLGTLAAGQGKELQVQQQQQQMSKERLAVESRSRNGTQLLGPFRYQRAVEKEASRHAKDNSGRLTVHSTSSSSDSSYSPRSVAARELWNTDDHPEEAFTGLFVRRPGQGGHTAYAEQRPEHARAPSDGDKFGQAPMSHAQPALVLDSSKTRDSTYRSSLDTRRDSAHIEKLVGSYISTLSDPETQTNASLERNSVQQTDVDLYRQGVRLGRVGGRTPVISQAFYTTDKTGPQGSDDEVRDADITSPRARLDSFAASVVLTGEGNSPDAQEHDQAPLEAAASPQDNTESSEERLSEGSLINMVRDYVWPDPPKGKGRPE